MTANETERFRERGLAVMRQRRIQGVNEVYIWTAVPHRRSGLGHLWVSLAAFMCCCKKLTYDITLLIPREIVVQQLKYKVGKSANMSASMSYR